MTRAQLSADIFSLKGRVALVTGSTSGIGLALARGLANKDLAAELGISVNTVKFHLRNLYDKLGVNSRAQAIAFYYSTGGTR